MSDTLTMFTAADYIYLWLFLAVVALWITLKALKFTLNSIVIIGFLALIGLSLWWGWFQLPW